MDISFRSLVSMSRNSLMFLLAFLILCSTPDIKATTCVSCASTILKSQWQVTNFPISGSANITFDDKICGSVTTSAALTTDCPTGLCVEMLLVVGRFRKCLILFSPIVRLSRPICRASRLPPSSSRHLQR